MMTTFSSETTDSVIAIDFGTGRIKIAYSDKDTKDAELMRLGRQGEFFLPAYIGVTGKGDIVIGDQAERMIDDEGEARWVRDTAKRDLSVLKTLCPRLPRGERSRWLPYILEEGFSALRTRVLQHPAFRGKAPTRVYVTYTPLYPRTIKEHFEQAAETVFATSDIVSIDEARAAAEMLRHVPETSAAASDNGKDDLILLDCGAGTIDCGFLRWSENGYTIYPLERMQQAYVSIPLGGIDIDNALVKRVKQKAGEAFNDRKASVSVRQQVRLAKHEYCLYGSGSRAWSIRVNPEKEVVLCPDEIQTAIRSEYIDKLCEPSDPSDSLDKKRSEHDVLTDYIDGIKGSLPIDREPRLVLVGGSAGIEGFDNALQKAFDLQVSTISDLQRGAYATVLGPIYADMKKQKVSRAREEAVRETRQTPSGVKTDDPFADRIQALDFSPNCKYLVAAVGKCIKRWEIATENTTRVSLARKRTLEHTDTISAVAFSDDGKLFGAATYTGTIRLWATESNIPIIDFTSEDSTITDLAFSPDATHFATGDKEGKVKLWNIHSGKAVETFVGRKEKYRHKGSVNALAFSPEGHLLASGGQEGVVNIWQVGTTQKPFTTRGIFMVEEEDKYPVIYVGHAFDMNEHHAWSSLGFDGTSTVWARYDRIISFAPKRLDATWREKSGTLDSMLASFPINSRYVQRFSLNLRGMHPCWINNGKLKVCKATDDMEAIELPYTDTLSCIAMNDIATHNPKGHKYLVALGSQEGSIQLWDGGREWITLQ